MDEEHFKESGRVILDFLSKYLSTELNNAPVLPSVEQGYLHQILPNQSPDQPEKWTDVLEDFKTKIYPGLTHWQSPYFFGYYGAPTSHPNILGEMLTSGLNVCGLNWISSPAVTELEVIVLDWFGKFFNLPREFLFEEGKGGGGSIYGGASETIFTAAVVAREEAIKHHVANGSDEDHVRSRLVMYSSDQSNCTVAKQAKLASLKFKGIETGTDLVMTGKMLEDAVTADLRAGKIPCICVATVGTTGTCTFDDVASISEVCRRFGLYCHVDAAYAGNAFCLPEYSYLLKPLENVDSININLSKLLPLTLDSALMWFKDTSQVERSTEVDQHYVLYESPECTWAPFYRNWGLPLSRPFRSLKMWFTMKMFGNDKLKNDLRERFALAEYLCDRLRNDTRIVVIHEPRMGLFTFQVSVGEKQTRSLVKLLTERKRIFVLPWEEKGLFLVRIVIAGHGVTKDHMDFTFQEIITQINMVFELNRKL